MPESNDQKKRSRSPSDGDGVTSNKRANVGQGAASAGLSDNDRRGANNSSEKPSDDVTMADANGKSSTDNAPPVPAAQIHMRCLIVTQDASIIIGKGGSHVNEIREKSGAKVVVSESIPGNPERILNVSGPLDAVSKAFGLIVRRINDEPFDVPSVPGSRAVTIKFIIPNSRMGSVIGKGGSKIKEIQEVSGARLNASEGVLPGSTERVLSVSGVADAIHIATYYVGNILIEAGPVNHNTSSYRPSGTMQQPSSGGGGGGGRGSGASRYPPNSSYNPAQSFGGAPMYGAPSVPNQTQQIYIPNDLVGCIIGKGGSKINEIRSMSGSTIKIMEPGATANGQTQDGSNERLVTVTGQPQQIQTAVQLLYHRLEQEKQKQMANVSRSGV